MERAEKQFRVNLSGFKTRENENELYIEGYFAVFGSVYEVFPGATESIAPGAFAETLGGDIRALIDHETRLVLGRTTAGTLELREDAYGLWGRIHINRADSDAMNLYERVRRGDVNQCSFGFFIVAEDTEYREDGSVHWTIMKAELLEVSVVTFPAYEETSVSARKRDYEEVKKKKREEWRNRQLRRLKGE